MPVFPGFAHELCSAGGLAGLKGPRWLHSYISQLMLVAARVSLSQSTSPPCQSLPASEIDFLSGRLSTVLLEATVEVTKPLKAWLLSHITPLFYILFVRASPRPAQIQRIKEVDTMS